MNTSEVIERVEKEWELERGFLGQLRQGRFDKSGYQRLRDVLGDISSGIASASLIDRRLVSVVWYIPIFMTWQRDRIKDLPVDEYDRAANELQTLVQETLGVP